MVTVYLALGSNLGRPAQHVQAACARLADLPQTRVLQVAKLYHSQAQGFEGPDFVNTVARIETNLNAYALLAALQQIEVDMGRSSALSRLGQKKTSRTIDLDILFYGQARIHSPSLIVPHPRMDARDFVQVPLQEVWRSVG